MALKWCPHDDLSVTGADYVEVASSGANRKGNEVTQGMRDVSWFQGMQGGLKNELDSIKVFSETDFTEDLEKFDVRTLIIHGDDDQIVLIAVSATLSSKLVRNATLKIYRGCPHGPADTHTDQPSSTRKDAHMEALAFAFLPGRAGSAAR